MGRVHIHPLCVYYEDTDFSGVVYHANYLKFFERAREHLLGIDKLARLYREEGIGFVVHRLDVTFKEPARHGDTLQVRTTLRTESEYRVVFNQAIWRPDGRFPLVKGQVDLVCVSDVKGLIPVPSHLLEALAAWEEDAPKPRCARRKF